MATQRATCSSIGWSGGRRVAQEGVLGDLAPTAGPLAWREGRERLGVAQHGVRLPEGADQVLALGQVHPRLAADGRVDLGQQRGGHVDVRGAPVVGGGGEPGHVGHDAAAHGDDHVGPGEAEGGEAPGQRLDRGQRLGLLAVGDEADLDGQARVEAVEPAGVALIASWVTTAASLAPGGTKRATSWRAPGPTSTG